MNQANFNKHLAKLTGRITPEVKQALRARTITLDDVWDVVDFVACDDNLVVGMAHIKEAKVRRENIMQNNRDQFAAAAAPRRERRYSGKGFVDIHIAD